MKNRSPIAALFVALVSELRQVLRPLRSGAHLAAGAARDLVRTRSELLAENALLRQQVLVLRRTVARPALYRDDRLLLLFLARLTPRWRQAVHLVRPETVLRWHRDLFKIVWRRKSRAKGRPGRLPPESVALIRSMARDNVLWGAERIRGELLKLGIRVSKRSVQKCIRHVRPRGRPGQSWATFLRNHNPELWACDFLQLHDILFRPIFAFFFVIHGTREVVHFHVTRHPTEAWVTQQLREATVHDDRPRYLIRDNDGKYGGKFDALAVASGIEMVRIPPRSPNLNPICERFLGSVRRECLDHIVILGERQLRRVLREYIESYFNTARPHQGLGQRMPRPSPSTPEQSPEGRLIAIPVLGGLHHDYRWAA